MISLGKIIFIGTSLESGGYSNRPDSIRSKYKLVADGNKESSAPEGAANDDGENGGTQADLGREANNAGHRELPYVTTLSNRHGVFRQQPSRAHCLS